MDIKTTATYPYPIWGLPDNYKGDDPAGHRVGLKKDTDEDVIVEFGSNKNCRIIVNKTAIAQVEKPSGNE